MTSYQELQSRLLDERHVWLVTGVAGFIGSNLLEALLRLDQAVVGLDNFSTGHHRNLEQVKAAVSQGQWARFRLIDGDIRDREVCKAACDGVEYVLSHAALASIQRSMEDPVAANSVNADGFLNLLVAARDAKVIRLVYASSSAVYGDNQGAPAMEGDAGKPLSPYAATKLVNELYADMFARLYGFNSIGLRYFNIFGPRQDPAGAYSAVIPKWISAMIRGETAWIYGDGETSRDFCHIANVVQANLLAATNEDSDAINQVYNVGMGEGTTLNNLFKAVRSILEPRYPHLKNTGPGYLNFRTGDVRHSVADIGKASRLLRYEPTHNLMEGLTETVDWYVRSVVSGENP